MSLLGQLFPEIAGRAASAPRRRRGPPPRFDREAMRADRRSGMTIAATAAKHGCSNSTVEKACNDIRICANCAKKIDIEELRADRAEGLTLSQIAKKRQCNVTTVHRYLGKLAIPLEVKRAAERRRCLADPRRQNIWRRYDEAGESVRSIARDLGISHQAVYLLLAAHREDAGLPKRGRGRFARQRSEEARAARQSAILGGWNRGLTVQDIAEECRLHPGTVGNVLRSHGISTRHRKPRSITARLDQAVAEWDAGVPAEQILSNLGYRTIMSLRSSLHQRGRRGPAKGDNLAERRAAARRP